MARISHLDPLKDQVRQNGCVKAALGVKNLSTVAACKAGGDWVSSPMTTGTSRTVDNETFLSVGGHGVEAGTVELY